MRRESVKSAGIYHEEVLETSYQKWIRSQLEKRFVSIARLHVVSLALR